MLQKTGMEKENSATGGRGEAATINPGSTSNPEKLQADQQNPLLDPAALFGGKIISLIIFQ